MAERTRMPKVGLYLRLSREDGETGGSQSIQSQRQALEQFLQKKGWTAQATYIDDGWSGMDFQRPGFQDMLADLNRGSIDTVLVKDLSRLGRDHIQTGYYLEVYFPQRQIRCLSLSEQYDSWEPGGVAQLIPFYFALNDLYAQDISRKVRASLTARKRAGRFIGSSPPFGYRRDPQDPGRLLPDPAAAEDLRRLWRRFLETGSVAGTAHWLTEQGLPTPSQRKGGAGGQWNQTMVRNILTNPTYAGHLTQNRSQRLGPKLPQKRAIDSAHWITVADTHPPLVSQGDFDQAQKLLARRSYQRGEQPPHPLSGLAFCADCGGPMTYVRENPQRTYLVCQTYRKKGRGFCTPHRVREDQLLQAVGAALEAWVTAGVDQEALTRAVADRLSATTEKAQETVRSLERNHRMRYQLYRDTAEGHLSQEDHRRLLAELNAERERLERPAEEVGDLRGRVAELLAFRPPHRALLLALVEKVTVHEGKRVEVFLLPRKV